jgi:hypothetical protein
MNTLNKNSQRSHHRSKSRTQNNEIFEKLWLDVTLNQKIKEEKIEKLRKQIYPFVPNLGKPRDNTTEVQRQKYFRCLSS